MSTLLLRFAAPMQSWGSYSRFQWRETDKEPTKSAVIGMLAAALGRRRDESIDDLVNISFGVRIDQPGRLIRDFHTAQTVDRKQAFISYRRYLSDAVFLVALQDTDAKLEIYQSALLSPAFPLFLGRRSCPPAQPLVLGIREGLDLMTALQTEPWQAAEFYQRRFSDHPYIDLEVVIDAPFGSVNSYVKRDLPLTFNQTDRLYSFRSLASYLGGAIVENPLSVVQTSSMTDHDAIAAIGEDQ